MEFTETTIREFFRTVGNPAAAERLIGHLRERSLVLVEYAPLEEALPKKASRDRR